MRGHALSGAEVWTSASLLSSPFALSSPFSFSSPFSRSFSLTLPLPLPVFHRPSSTARVPPPVFPRPCSAVRLRSVAFYLAGGPSLVVHVRVGHLRCSVSRAPQSERYSGVCGLVRCAVAAATRREGAAAAGAEAAAAAAEATGGENSGETRGGSRGFFGAKKFENFFRKPNGVRSPPASESPRSVGLPTQKSDRRAYSLFGPQWQRDGARGLAC